jgi:hypothetical protein
MARVAIKQLWTISNDLVTRISLLEQELRLLRPTRLDLSCLISDLPVDRKMYVEAAEFHPVMWQNGILLPNLIPSTSGTVETCARAEPGPSGKADAVAEDVPEVVPEAPQTPLTEMDVDQDMIPPDTEVNAKLITALRAGDFSAVVDLVIKYPMARSSVELVFPIYTQEISDELAQMRSEFDEITAQHIVEEQETQEREARVATLLKDVGSERSKAPQVLLDLEADIALQRADLHSQEKMLEEGRRDITKQSLLLRLMSDTEKAVLQGDAELVSSLSRQLKMLRPSKHADADDITETIDPLDVVAAPAGGHSDSFKLAPISQRGMAGTSAKQKRPHGSHHPSGSSTKRFQAPPRDARGRTLRQHKTP